MKGFGLIKSAGDIRHWHQVIGLVFALVLIAMSISGVLLASAPVLNALSPTSQPLGNQTVASLLENINPYFNDIERITITSEHKVIVASHVASKRVEQYVDIRTGQAIGAVEVNPFYSELKTFHRSLWLNNSGRIVVTFSAISMAILSITGLFLLIRRQGGWRGLFLPPQGKGSARWHSLLGQALVLPLIILAVSGTFLGLDNLNVLPSGTEAVAYPESLKELKPVESWTLAPFKTMKLRDISSIVFPISEDWFDVFTVKTKNGYLFYDQFTGEQLTSQHFSALLKTKHWMLLLHSGQGAPWWAIFLGFTALAIPFFSATGILIWWRKPKLKRTFSKANAKTADAVILVGSETQTTWHFAEHLFNVLTKHNLAVHKTDLNSVQHYPKARWVFVLTATYGNGQPPSNARHFINKIKQVAHNAQWQFSVVGFGDRGYQNYCQYAKQIEQELKNYSRSLHPLHTVNQQDSTDFNHWGAQLSALLNFPITWAKHHSPQPTLQYETMPVVAKRYSPDGTVLQLTLGCEQSFQPGDLLSVRLNDHSRARLYSVASHSQNSDLTLFIKKVQAGQCSTFLHQLSIGDTVQARVQHNSHFHLPSIKKPVIFIATGTGIAPFVGMISNNNCQQPLTLFLGCRHPQQDSCYEHYLTEWQQKNRLTKCFAAYSRIERPAYVQDLALQQADHIIDVLNRGGYIMLCGGTAMSHAVAKTLNQLFIERNTRYRIAKLQRQGRFIVEAYGN